MGNKREPFEPEVIYHVYNHGNGDELIFREPENYRFFLKRFRDYIHPIGKIYAYCLLPNHFHFLLRIREKDSINNYFKEIYPDLNHLVLTNEQTSNLLLRRFKNFLISYSKPFNSMYERRGSLFLDNLERKSVRHDEYFTNMVRYIHFNPVLHGFVDMPSQWKFSSFISFYSNKRSSIHREDIFEWFG
jgi:REP element-mobilizing transposase RayT